MGAIRTRVRQAAKGALILAIAAAVLTGLSSSARIAAARLHGGPLALVEYGYGSLDSLHPDLWVGCGFRNRASAGIRIVAVEVIPLSARKGGSEVVGVFFTDLPVGCPPVNDGPRSKGVRGYADEGFAIPAGQTRGAFIHFRLPTQDVAPGVDVYRLRVLYRCGLAVCLLEPSQFIRVHVVKRAGP